MFHHALVAVDLSPAGQVLLGCVPQLRGLGVKRVTLLHVAPVDYPVAGAMAHVKEYGEILNELAGQMRDGGFEVTAEARHGSPPGEILRMAEEAGASLILLGSRSRNRLRETFVGSVALKILEASQVPVLFIRLELVGQGDDGAVAALCCPMDEALVLAVDFSPAGERALAVAAELSRHHGGRALTLVHAAKAGGVTSEMSGGRPGVVGDGGERLRKLADRLRAEGTGTVHTQLEEGDPVDAILKAVNRAGESLLVMGTRGMGLLGRLALGSVSRGVLGKVQVPVLMVPEDQASRSRGKS
ncbi:MAG: universal stress protein [Gemmatimonadota bacterium]